MPRLIILLFATHSLNGQILTLLCPRSWALVLLVGIRDMHAQLFPLRGQLNILWEEILRLLTSSRTAHEQRAAKQDILGAIVWLSRVFWFLEVADAVDWLASVIPQSLELLILSLLAIISRWSYFFLLWVRVDHNRWWSFPGLAENIGCLCSKRRHAI